MSPAASCGLPRTDALLDLRAACAETARVALGVRDDQLHAPTPCGGRDGTWLLAHLLGLPLAFTPGAAGQDGDAPAPAGLDLAGRDPGASAVVVVSCGACP